MAYAGIQMFMEKLKQLISCNIPFTNNNPDIISERPQFQLLYDELGPMIQTLFIDQHHDHLDKLNDLKRTFIYAAEEAECILDLFLSDVHIRNNQHFPISEASNSSLNFDDVGRVFKSVEAEFKSMRIHNMITDSSQGTINQSAAAQSSISRNSLKLLDEIVVVGFDGDAGLIIEKLVAHYPKKLDVVSIVGMGGIGKTTLATKVFNDAYVKHHFHVRVWVTVSQSYDKRGVLIQILASIGVKENLEEASDSRLRELVHKNLMGRRYLIVTDDIWQIEAWDNLKLFFPHDNNGSRILLTTRLTEVAKHANSDGLIHHLGYLNKETSWELLCKRVFHGHEYPKWSVKHGTRIVENCKGLPLSVVVIAGVLAKQAYNEIFWVEIAERTGSYIVSEENGCLEALGLSYSHLPMHLRECFLYLGGFPEDYKFNVRRLIWLWVAEGFIEKDGNRSLEDIAEGYLMDLIDRNLVDITKRMKSNGGVKICKVHDLVKELCLRKSKEEGFILETETLVRSSSVITSPYKSVHMLINTNDPFLTHPSTQNLRSILCFSDVRSLSDDIAKYFRSFVLLRVLDLQTCDLRDFPKGVELLVHLRYLAVSISSTYFPSSICNLWNLQTLIYSTIGFCVCLPSNISDMVNLRHLVGRSTFFIINSIEKPMNLQTVSRLWLEGKEHSLQKYFPSIKKLQCFHVSDKQNDFKSFNHLESLTISSFQVDAKNHFAFPATLKSLTLYLCGLPWRDMSIIQSLPNLQVMKLKQNAFVGSCWNTDGQEFSQLKFLMLESLDIKQWEVYSTSFPCLTHLVISSCYDLEETPLEIGDIPTLELIEVQHCRESIDESARRIQEEQQDMGNYSLSVKVIPSEAINEKYNQM